MSALPSRRDEAWRWSDLRAALSEPPALAPGDDHVIARLGPVRSVTVAEGREETLLSHLAPAGLEAETLDIEVGANATLTRLLLQTGDGVALSLARVRLGAGAHFRQFVLSEGARLARIETEIVLEGHGAVTDVAGIYLVGDGRHADFTSRIIHSVPDTITRQTVRGVARAGGRGVFQGRIDVESGAARVDARQHHAGLMLEDGAEILAKPELRIHCDDVQCAHGNTVGALDANALFYMRQRGIPEPAARALLTETFLLEALPDWLGAEMRGKVEGQLRSWLERQP